jgi:hypothetical protein
MNRRAFISCTTFGMLAGPLTAAAQQTQLAAFHGELEKQPMRTLANRRLRAQGKAQLRRDGGAGDVWA